MSMTLEDKCDIISVFGPKISFGLKTLFLLILSISVPILTRY